MTPWLNGHLDDAEQLLQAKRYREAIQSLLIVLSVYPGLPAALSLAANVIYDGARRNKANALTSNELGDPRLDSVFCSCESARCNSSWVSYGQLSTSSAFEQIEIINPSGVRCISCGGYFCRKHYIVADVAPPQRIQCPRCGGETDAAPHSPNGRSSRQTSRLNHPLVHVYLGVESQERPSSEYVVEILTAVSPDVFDELAGVYDRSFITSWVLFPWPESAKNIMRIKILMDNEDHLSERHAAYFFPGMDTQGKNFLLAKIYSKVTKYIDPDKPV